jgi:uncharacterized protein
MPPLGMGTGRSERFDMVAIRGPGSAWLSDTETTEMTGIIEKNQASIADLCRRFGVRKLDVFGSAATGAFDPASSDIDFVVDFADRSPGYARRFFAFEAALSALPDTDGDLLTERSIRNPYLRASIEETRVPVYESPDRQAAA